VPARDTHLFDNEPHELLAAVEVESVDARRRAPCEVEDASPESVVGCQFVALDHERVALSDELVVAGIEFMGAPPEIGQLEQAGLIEIGQTPTLPTNRSDLAVETGELGGQQFVVWRRALRRDGGFASEEQFGSHQRGADTVEDKGVEFIGTDVAFGAPVVLTAGPHGVMVVAPVVAMDRAVAAAHLVAADPHGAVATLHQAA